ncbi:MAG: PhnD/SsuA/transferrin family substrate-binding protein [Roseiarcus sp.]|jgi:ABC-type phosphate/phosphonate transport system substrate-binding protein
MERPTNPDQAGAPVGPAATAPLVASLGMYDFPWLAEANDALWAGIAARLRAGGVAAPARLSRGAEPAALWRDPGLLFGQTCGYPYVTALRGAVALIATPVYAFDGCEGAEHCSFVVARLGDSRRGLADFAGARAALNAGDSNSGMNLFRATIAPLARGAPFFAAVIETGSHRASLEAVGAGAADLAAIDCVSFALIAAGRPELVAGIGIVARTPRAPALPFVISAALAGDRLDAVRGALFATLEDPALAPARARLGLVGARVLGEADYQRIAEIERAAVAAGYPALA